MIVKTVKDVERSIFHQTYVDGTTFSVEMWENKILTLGKFLKTYGIRNFTLKTLYYSEANGYKYSFTMEGTTYPEVKNIRRVMKFVKTMSL